MIKLFFSILPFLLLCCSSEKRENKLADSGEKSSIIVSDPIYGCEKMIYIQSDKDYIYGLLSEHFNKKGFFETNASRLYYFKVYLDSNLNVEGVKIEIANNREIAENIANIFDKIEYKKIYSNDSCRRFEFDFIINAKSQSLAFPDSKEFYNIAPKEIF